MPISRSMGIGKVPKRVLIYMKLYNTLCAIILNILATKETHQRAFARNFPTPRNDSVDLVV